MPKKAKNARAGVYIVADTREDAVIPYLDEALGEYDYAVKQINTGDYVICEKPRLPGAEPLVRACFERKSLKDFAASLNDGRIDNTDKMLDLRAKTGCALYYIVEGSAFPSPDKTFGRVPYSRILGTITRLMACDGVFVVQTRDPQHTAKRLADFTKVYAQNPTAPDEKEDEVVGVVGAEEAGAPASLLGRIARPDHEEVASMWARLHGVTYALGKKLAETFSVAALATREVGIDVISSTKTVTGRAASKSTIASLLAVRDGAQEAGVRLLSGVSGITEPVAQSVLEKLGGLPKLCTADLSAIEAVSIQQKTRAVKLGRAKAERIMRLLKYRTAAAGLMPADATPAGQAAAGRDPAGMRELLDLVYCEEASDEVRARGAAPPKDQAGPPEEKSGARPEAGDADVADLPLEVFEEFLSELEREADE
jgi:ERCC4-type nuclease